MRLSETWHRQGDAALPQCQLLTHHGIFFRSRKHFALPRIVRQNADWIALLAFNEKAVSRGTGGGLLELSLGIFLFLSGLG
jgi:hypothetical protein